MTDHKVALITGASRGIGAVTAKLLASKGMRIIVNYNNSARLTKRGSLIFSTDTETSEGD